MCSGALCRQQSNCPMFNGNCRVVIYTAGARTALRRRRASETARNTSRLYCQRVAPFSGWLIRWRILRRRRGLRGTMFEGRLEAGSGCTSDWWLSPTRTNTVIGDERRVWFSMSVGLELRCIDLRIHLPGDERANKNRSTSFCPKSVSSRVTSRAISMPTETSSNRKRKQKLRCYNASNLQHERLVGGGVSKFAW